MDGWTWMYEGFDPESERLREALCTLGNGRFATRGAAPEAEANEVHYPGTYVAGLYDRQVTKISGRDVENEDLVNVPNWLPLRFRIEDGPWFDLSEVDLLDYRQELDLRRGVLTRHVRFTDAGRTTRVTQRRFVHMDDPHLAGLETTFLAEDWSGTVFVRSGLDGSVENTGVPRYRDLASKHLEVLETSGSDDAVIALTARTLQSKVRIAVAARTEVRSNGDAREVPRELHEEDEFVAHDLEVQLEQNDPVTVEKIAALYTSGDHAISQPTLEAVKRVRRARRFEQLLEGHVVAWEHLWNRFDIEIDGPERTQVILRVHLFHLLCTVSENTIDLDVGVPARGLHGEAYRGHIFWDELFILPQLTYRIPILARSLLAYRHRRLFEARWAAREEGYRGAMFPWQSGSDGREETQTVHLNPKSGRWHPDRSHRQRHINIAIAYNVWHQFEVTGDESLLSFMGGELLLEIARFLASLATYNRSLDRYEILGVMGPDEFHDGYPDADEGGLDNNAYTNVMTAWVLTCALELLDTVAPYHADELRERLSISPEELHLWEEISHKLVIPFHDGVISQFEGYEDLEEFDWEGYEDRYGDIQRLDRILEAEEDSPNNYKASKQADVLMLFYLLSEEHLRAIFERLGYELSDELVQRTIEYYLERTSHGSTLSRVVHSWVLARRDRSQSWHFLEQSLESDVADIQGGTTEEGIHLGAMAGSVDLLQRGCTGLDVRGGALTFDPALPDELEALRFPIHFRGRRIDLELTHEDLHVQVRPGPDGPIRVCVYDEEVELEPGMAHRFAI
ncbi:MAG: glycosyl hydrolase family 65 protein [Nitriliruptorales bacterium]|nr:glycosyl hydrolase family 65 protein [Nitriliruptorales bacterium]